VASPLPTTLENQQVQLAGRTLAEGKTGAQLQQQRQRVTLGQKGLVLMAEAAAA
jgi:hypothetical protein